MHFVVHDVPCHAVVHGVNNVIVSLNLLASYLQNALHKFTIFFIAIQVRGSSTVP